MDRGALRLRTRQPPTAPIFRTLLFSAASAAQLFQRHPPRSFFSGNRRAAFSAASAALIQIIRRNSVQGGELSWWSTTQRVKQKY
jgi:hypothetical protein